jgi:hypothetical protein
MNRPTNEEEIDVDLLAAIHSPGGVEKNTEVKKVKTTERTKAHQNHVAGKRCSKKKKLRSFERHQALHGESIDLWLNRLDNSNDKAGRNAVLRE